MNDTAELIQFNPSNIVVFTEFESTLIELEQDAARTKHDFDDPQGLIDAKSDVKKATKSITAIEKIRKKEKKESLDYGRALDKMAKGITARLEAVREINAGPIREIKEAEQRRKNEEAAIFLAEQARAKYELDHEMGLLLDEKYDREEAARKEKVEQERIANEKRMEEATLAREKEIREKAAEQARLEAEEKAQKEAQRIEQEKQEAIGREQAAQQRAKQAERDTIAAEERAKAQAELAEKQAIEAEAAAKKEMKAAAEMAKQDEIDRQAREAAKDKAEEEKREANKRHVSGILKKAKLALISAAGIDEEIAKKVILAIRSNQIPSVSIRF